MSLSSSYYAEKATKALAALALSSNNLSTRVRAAAMEFVFIPQTGLPREVMDLIAVVRAKTIDHVPEVEQRYGSDPGTIGAAVRSQGRIVNNLAEMSWQEKAAG